MNKLSLVPTRFNYFFDVHPHSLPRIIKSDVRAFPFCTTTNPDTDDTLQDAFRVFDLPHTFDIDLVKLKKVYLQMMEQSHPDKKQHNKSSLSGSLEASAITSAYDLLRAKHTRAIHLVEVLSGESFQEEIAVGNEFLMEVMELREEVDRSIETGNETMLRKAYVDNAERIEETCRLLGKAIDAMELEEASKQVAALQYWNRIDEAVQEGLHHIEDK